jgi:hypothetical protein
VLLADSELRRTPLLGTWVNKVSRCILSTHCARHSGASNGSLNILQTKRFEEVAGEGFKPSLTGPEL